jgi:hypothetical protein
MGVTERGVRKFCAAIRFQLSTHLAACWVQWGVQQSIFLYVIRHLFMFLFSKRRDVSCLPLVANSNPFPVYPSEFEAYSIWRGWREYFTASFAPQPDVIAPRLHDPWNGFSVHSQVSQQCVIVPIALQGWWYIHLYTSVHELWQHETQLVMFGNWLCRITIK